MKSFLETWRPVVGYEGLYEVSDFGDVRSLNYLHTGKTRVLKLIKEKKGYLLVNLYKEGKMKMYKAHRLVAQAFIDNPDNLPEVNHIDEDKTNNRVSNLEWCNHIYNSNHGTRNQRIAETQKGSKRPYMSEVQRNNPKKSEIVLQMTLDYVFVKEWPSTKECGRNGFTQSAVAACCRNEYGKQENVYKGYRWIKKEDYEKQLVA